MKKNILFLLTCLVFLFITSCRSTDMELYLTEDIWKIETISYKNKNIEPLLFSNILRFKKDGVCLIPIIPPKEGLINKEDRVASWSLSNSNQLYIKSTMEYLNGEYNICFGKDKTYQLVYIIIKSKNMYMKAYKGNFGKSFNIPLPIKCPVLPLE